MSTLAFDMSDPCGDCPFRLVTRQTGGAFYLTRGRAEEIAFDLRQEKTFTCHKTAHSLGATGVEQQCAGARMVAEKEGGVTSQLLRIFGRLGVPIAKLGDDSVVYENFDEFIYYTSQNRHR